MNFEVITKVPFLQQQLDKRTAYFSDKLYLIKSNGFVPIENDKIRIIIVAKTHYTESWQTFSAINKAELSKLLTLKKQSVSSVNYLFQLVENKNIDGFEVKTIEFSSALIEQLGSKNVYVPETELFHLNGLELVEVESPLGTLFSSVSGRKVSSAYAKGLVANVETYRLTVGVSNEKPLNKISAQQLPAFLIKQLLSIPVARTKDKALINPKAWVDANAVHWLYGAPLITAFVFYVLSNTYLAYSIHQLESDIGAGGEVLSSVLEQKKAIDNKTALINQLSIELSARTLTHAHWDIVYQTLEEGAKLTRVTYKKGELTLRGSVNKASSLLTMLSENEAVASASFKGAVRKSGKQESFIINIIPKESV